MIDTYGFRVAVSIGAVLMAAFGLLRGLAGDNYALVLGIFHYRPSPFCLLDEVDAPLDEANISRFTNKVVSMSTNTQFIVITHNKRTMETARALYGVTMEEPGVSKLVSVKFE